MFLFSTGNSKKMVSDFYSGAFPKYKNEFMARQATILLHPDSPVLRLGNIPGTFRIVDVRSDSTWWVDKCMKRFYTETNIVLR